MEKLQELLTITMEECGELIQACSKAIRCDDYRDNKKLIQEIADVYCMIELIHEYDLVSWDDWIDEDGNWFKYWNKPNPKQMELFNG